MAKRGIDLTVEELDRLAAEAWCNAATDALKRGAPVTGREGDHIVKTYPNGRKEILADAPPFVDVAEVRNGKEDDASPREKRRRRTGSRTRQARRIG